MRISATFTPFAWITLSGVLIIGMACRHDAVDPPSNCQVVSPNDTWVRNNVREVVVAPKCPVRIPQFFTNQDFAANIYAPAGMPRAGTFCENKIYDASNFAWEQVLNPWGTYSSS